MTDARPTTREEAADRYETLAAELERAAAHLRHAARHLRDGDAPRACAHAWATQGHLVTVGRGLGEVAELHASQASV